MSGYRACYWQSPDGQVDIVLTGPDDALLSDERLRCSAITCAFDTGLIGDEFPCMSESELLAGLKIGLWRECHE
jgi:hypothetical protein